MVISLRISTVFALLLLVSLTSAVAGEVNGTISDGGRPIAAGTKVVKNLMKMNAAEKTPTLPPSH